MQVLRIYLENGALEKAQEYIAQMNEALDEVDQTVKSGHSAADAIINSKLSLARSRHISLDTTFQLPAQLPFSDLEFCVLFGNLMDNAIEACMSVNDESSRFIRVYIGMFQQQFYLSVLNSTPSDK